MADGTRMQQRRATEAVWTTSDYVLAAGELGVTTDTGIIKIGNGTSPWSELDIAFGSEYLPLLGTATNSELLEGISAASFVKVIDTTTAATPDKVMLRLSDGRAKAATATASDDLTTKAQMDAAIAAAQASDMVEIKKGIVGRTITASAALVLTDVSKLLFVNHASLTAQVVVTVPTNASVAFPVGSWIEIVSTGAGGTRITPAGGVTVNGATTAMPGYGAVRLMKVDTNTWYGISINAGKRLPKIRVVRTAGAAYTTGTPTCIPWNSVDSTVDFYNPDNEWFSIPGTGLNTARRIIANKDGEYLVQVNFITTATAAGALIIAKMVADNTLAGGTYFCNVPTFGTGQAIVRVRLAAGESIGAAWQPPGAGGSDQADNTFSNRNDFTITRLSD